MITTIFENQIQELITMKNLFFVFAAVAVFFSCAPENNPGGSEGQEPVNNNPKELIVTGEASDIDYISVTLSGYANIPEGTTGVTFGILLSRNENPTVDNGMIIQAKELDGNNRFLCSVNNLLIGTKYYYKAYLKEGDYYRTGSKTLSFTTKDLTDESIVTEEASKIDFISATLKGSTNLPIYFGTECFGVIISEDKDPTIDNGSVIEPSEWDGDYSFFCNVTNLKSLTTYSYKAYFKYNGEYRMGKTLSFTTKDFDSTQPVDLGLSVKWASVNLGASKPEEYGDFYSWGETKPTTNYSASNYKYCYKTSTGYKYTKYCTDSSYGYKGYTDGKTVLDPEDDAAHVILGGKWRMPTNAEWIELVDNCTWEITSMNGKYVLKVSGPNGNSIFLPFAGYHIDLNYYGPESDAFYWSSSLYTDNPHLAWLLAFDKGELKTGKSNRCYGYPIRPVTE